MPLVLSGVALSVASAAMREYRYAASTMKRAPTGIWTPPPSVYMKALLDAGSVTAPDVVRIDVTSCPAEGLEPSGIAPETNANVGDGLRCAMPAPPRTY